MRKCVNFKLEWMKSYDTIKKKATLHVQSTCDEASMCVYIYIIFTT